MTIPFSTNIISAARKILIDDNTEPSIGHCIDYFVPNEKIIHGGNVKAETPPYISLWFETGESFSGLPAQNGELTIEVWYNEHSLQAKTKLEQCSSRIVHLLDKKPSTLNAQGFSTEVKSIKKLNVYSIPPDDDGLIHHLIVFAVIYSDNWNGES